MSHANEKTLEWVLRPVEYPPASMEEQQEMSCYDPRCLISTAWLDDVSEYIEECPRHFGARQVSKFVLDYEFRLRVSIVVVGAEALPDVEKHFAAFSMKPAVFKTEKINVK